jgi:hypothetical protein
MEQLLAEIEKAGALQGAAQAHLTYALASLGYWLDEGSSSSSSG